MFSTACFIGTNLLGTLAENWPSNMEHLEKNSTMVVTITDHPNLSFWSIVIMSVLSFFLFSFASYAATQII
jgi:hypothetical protein